jgi:hypothetical protein
VLGLLEECPACSTAASSARQELEAAFAVALSLPDCRGAENLESCRKLEALLSQAFESLQVVLEAGRGEGTCLSCDPRPEVAPLASALLHLGRLLEEKGYAEFSTALRRMEGEVAAWIELGCCEAPAERTRGPRPPDREDDVRVALTARCGASFVDNRRGLRQVMRAPGAREGCYQSRACRETDSYEGLAIQAGYWTYDGEYWYVWAERRTPQGEWVSCDP